MAVGGAGSRRDDVDDDIHVSPRCGQFRFRLGFTRLQQGLATVLTQLDMNTNHVRYATQASLFF